MTKIDIFSGFLGAGKTTLIKKLVKDVYSDQRVVIIENEFGEIGIDGGFLKESGIMVNEINSGCICCSLVGDFANALKEVVDKYSPDTIIIEPSGVGKLSDVIKAVKNADIRDLILNSYTTVVDAIKCKMYMKNFGEFFNDQIENAGCVVLSHTDNMSEEKLAQCVGLIREHNKEAVIVTTPWDMLEGKQILSAMEKNNSLSVNVDDLEKEHIKECECGHHHEHSDERECGHHREHSEECECGHHHHADEVFESKGMETTNKYTVEEIKNALASLDETSTYGLVLRAKGIVSEADGNWIHFDYIPGEADVRYGAAEITGRICVIGSGLNEEEILKLFRI